ncbi:MAG: DUF429 domain-containing protein [Rhodoferax sp.]
MSARVLLGCDFSSAPTPKKTIALATGELCHGRVRLTSLTHFASLPAFSDWLNLDQAWVGAFDLPFGLPRELVQALGWPTEWAACMAHYAALSRDQIRQAFAAFCDQRPVGGKFAHRATDGPAGSSPSMKWVNPPVAFMLHAGVPLLLQAGASLPGLHTGQSPQKIALEGYPGLLAREVLGQRSYKSDDKLRQTPERLIARKDLITALEQGHTRLGLRLKLTHAQRDALADDARGDALDAVLCLMQAAWAQTRHDAGDALYGLPSRTDPLEGWIVSA